MRTAILFLLLFSFFSSSTTAQDAQISAAVDQFVARQMDSLSITGLAVAVVKDGTIIKMKSYGLASVEWKALVTEHTNFQIASCSKLLSSTVVLRSLALGKLHLEDPVAKYLDSLPATWQAIKVKHLLNHSSGIPFFNGDPYVGQRCFESTLRLNAAVRARIEAILYERRWHCAAPGAGKCLG
jgi:serine-type D-Ala-D-Ala carboxypeptidase